MKLTGSVLIDSLKRYTIGMKCPPELLSRVKTSQETMKFIYNSVYKSIRQKFPESMEPRSDKPKDNKIAGRKGMKDHDSNAQVRRRMDSQHGRGKVCRLICCADCSLPLDHFWLSSLPWLPGSSTVSVKKEELNTERIFL